MNVKAPKKLIEVALPLDAINAEAAREGFIYKGNPSAVHKWWAQRPLAAARAVIFGQLVNDPSWRWELEHPGEIPPNHLKASWAASRKRLFALVTDLVKWENMNVTGVMDRARAEIRKSWREVCEVNQDHPEALTLFDPNRLPTLYDPFAGGGSIPLEAQRLGLEAVASDLNPVAVLINKAMIEIPPRFAGRPPVHPEAPQRTDGWRGAEGLAEDVRLYGAWMRDEAQRRVGHLYPKVGVTAEMAEKRPDLRGYVGQELTVIAWLWARTVKSPNPAFSHVDVPLASSFVLGSKEGKEAWIEPMVEGDRYWFKVRAGKPPGRAEEGTKAPGRGANFRCVLSGSPIDGDYIKTEGCAGRMGARLMAVVAEGVRTRLYLDPSEMMAATALAARPEWQPSGEVPSRLTGGTCVPYGLREWGDLFTPRQLVALTTFVDLVSEVRERVRCDAIATSLPKDDVGVAAGGDGAFAYGESVSTYLAFALSKTAEYSNSLSVWYAREDRPKGIFARQAIPMVWDFPEQNPLGEIGGTFSQSARIVADALLGLEPRVSARVAQADAAAGEPTILGPFAISTDPPYYDNIGYADLSEFFYVWLRRALRSTFPTVLAAMRVPKAEELVATPHRHSSKDGAEAFFLRGMTAAMRRIGEMGHPALPISIYYAFKQSETKSDRERRDTSSTGWETFLGAVLNSGLALVGTWPVRTERQARAVGQGTNALASSIVLVCRKRPADAPTTSRRQFIRELNAVLPEALDEMIRGTGEDQSPVAPVDLSQAIIGPGMAVFSKYAAVLEADGTPMTVKTALQLINRFFAEDDFDADTQFCLRWFEQHGWEAGVYGEADVLARAKATSVGGLVEAGVVESGGGKVRLFRPAEYPADWDPRTDKRLPVWEALHQLIRAFKTEGESGSGKLLGAIKDKTEPIRQLAYRLYTLCERRGWAEDARAYNELVSSWSAVETVASAVPETKPVKQLDLFGST